MFPIKSINFINFKTQFTFCYECILYICVRKWCQSYNKFHVLNILYRLTAMLWSKNYPKNGVFSFIVWFYVASRIFGFFPFSIELDKKNEWSKVNVTIIDWFWFVISIFFYASAIGFTVYQTHLFVSYITIDVILSLVTLTAGNTIAVISIITDMINRKRIWKLISNFNQFDKKVINRSILLFTRVLLQRLTSISDELI